MPHVRKFVELATQCGRVMSNPEIISKSNDLAGNKVFDFPRPRIEGGFLKKSLLSGTLLPQYLENKKRTDEKFGYNFVFIYTAKENYKLNKILDAALMTFEAKGKIKEWMDKNNVTSLLVRPDKYIFSCGKEKKDTEEYLQTFLNIIEGYIPISEVG
jgi:hypothetical protein